MKRRKLYLLLTKFPDNGSKVIEALRGCHYPHASIGLEEDLNTFYSFVTKGFIIESVTRYVKPDREPFPCQVYELEVSDNVYRRIKDILEYFIEFREILHYTKLGVVLSLFHIPYRRDKFGFFCTQFVAFILEASGAVKLEKKNNHYFSDDLKRLPGMKLNFQGNLQTMIKFYGLPRSIA